MWQDVATQKDFLNFSEVANLAADAIEEEGMLPLSLGIFGGWGAGKSSMLYLIEEDLKKNTLPEIGNPYIFVHFDAWLFQDFDDARAALMETIANALLEETKVQKKPIDKACSLFKRVNYFRLAGIGLEAGASMALGIPPLGLLGKVGGALVNLYGGHGKAEDIKEIKEAGGTAKETLGGLLKPEETYSPPEAISDFRKEFSEVLNGLGKTLVVFIDNLDRCLPEVAIETLEAIRLFLFLPKTAFVIAADEDMIRHSVREHYKGPMDRHVTDYLDKLIQIPIRVPLIGVQEIRAYMFLLFVSISGADESTLERVRATLIDGLKNSWKGEYLSKEQVLAAVGTTTSDLVNQFNIAERLAPILAYAPNVSGNPRIVKRLLNTVRMRAKLAHRHGMPVDEALLAKLAVLERCTDDAAYLFLCKLINEAAGGEPELLSELEAICDSPDKFSKICPEEWTKHIPFLLQWFALEPSLAKRDLRAAVYLSRESVQLSVLPGKMSQTAMSVFKALMDAKRVSSPAASRAVQSLKDEEKIEIMTMLIGELKKVQDWQAPPAGFHGAVILANQAPQSAQSEFSAFLDSLPQVEKWMPISLEGSSWAKGLKMFQT